MCERFDYERAQFLCVRRQNGIAFLVPDGIEPPTEGLLDLRSTAELRDLACEISLGLSNRPGLPHAHARVPSGGFSKMHMESQALHGFEPWFQESESCVLTAAL